MTDPVIPSIVLDCDPGIDDALAILTALRYTDLVAITTVTGNVGIDDTTRNALAVCQIAGAEVPVHRGAATPLSGTPRHATHVHGVRGFGAVERPPLTRGTTSDDAVGYLLQVCRDRDDLWLVATGPLTNLARAWQRDRQFLERWQGCTIMGGSIRSGNATAAAEFNIWADPEAAAIVLSAGTTVSMVTLDVTRRVLATRETIDGLHRAGTPTAGLAAALLEHTAQVMVDGNTALHDPCAVLSVPHRELFGFHARRVDVELDGTHTRGMTIVDERRHSPFDPNCLVSYDVDDARVLQMIEDASVRPFRSAV